MKRTTMRIITNYPMEEIVTCDRLPQSGTERRTFYLHIKIPVVNKRASCTSDTIGMYKSMLQDLLS